jgi:general secretion pathway protein E
MIDFEKEVLTMLSTDDMLTIQEAADYLTTSRPTLYRWLREGKVRGRKVGRQWRFKKDELQHFLEGRGAVVDLPVDPAPFLQALRDQLSNPSPSDVDPLKEAFTLMVELLVQRQADSLHLGVHHTSDTTRTTACLRSRTDGLLRMESELDRRLVAPLIETWKGVAGCHPQETSLPQDGRILMETDTGGSPSRVVDLRVSFLPSMLGETMTVRWVNQGSGRASLDDFPLLESDRRRIRKALLQRSRLLIVSGPPGSSVESLIGAGLTEIAGPAKRTITVEGPAWQIIPWSSSLSLYSLGKNRNYATALRTALRSEPDILGVKSLPDQEAVEAAVEAALAGALVIAGFGARSAVDALRDLMFLAPNQFSLLQCLGLVVSTTRVRKLCEQCKISTDGQEWQPVGCDRCGGVGYSKSVLVGETLQVSRAFSELLLDGADEEALAEQARAEGTIHRAEQIGRLVRDGVTSAEEAGRVLH